MIKKYLKYIGFPVETEAFTQSHSYFATSKIEVAERYLTYLKEIDHYQKERRAAIENKNSQLVGQASIVTSIFSLFVPLLIDSFKEVSWFIKIPLMIIFLLVLLHYLLTIFHSIKTLKINRYKYATRTTSTVTKINRANTEIDFLNEEIKDLIFTINQTSPIDNIKGENLILGTRCFEIANIGFGFLTVLIILSTFTIPNEVPELKIKNINEIRVTFCDTLPAKLIKVKTPDTLTVDSIK